MPQSSDTTGAPSWTLALKQSPAAAVTVTLGAQLITGGLAPATVTCCWQLAVRPPRAVAVQVTIVVPTGNSFGASLTTLSMPQSSDTTGAPSSRLALKQLTAAAVTITLGAQ